MNVGAALSCVVSLAIACPLRAQCSADGSEPSNFGSSSATSNWQVGNAVAISGNRMAVGAALGDPSSVQDAGAAWIWEYNSGWSEVKALVDPSPSSFDCFGFSVAVAGDVVAVGVPDADGGGHVVVFRKSGGTWDNGTTLSPGGLSESGADDFGFAVALDGNTLVVGDPKADYGAGTPGINPGRITVFEYSGSSWSEVAYFDKPGTAKNFGHAVAIKGNFIIAGAPSYDLADGGEVHVYRRYGSPATWNYSEEITDDGDGSTQYGSSVAFDKGGGVVVGAPIDGSYGKVYVWKLAGTSEAETDTTWSQMAVLTPCYEADSVEPELFGNAVAILGDRLVVGSRYADVNNEQNAGAAYVFGRGCGWSLLSTVVDDDPSDNYIHEEFGKGAGVGGGLAVFGCPGDTDTAPDPDHQKEGSFTTVETGAEGCPADLDCSGSIDATDLATLLGAYMSVCYGCAEDIDRDGSVGSADLAILLGAWGDCFGDSFARGGGLGELLEAIGFESEEEFVSWSGSASEAERAAMIALILGAS